MGKLHKIKVPTFFLNAEDDPTFNPKLFPYKEFEVNDKVIVAITKRGGHCCHFTGGFRPY
jgi:predicted alpha/beta-fold hydrolase